MTSAPPVPTGAGGAEQGPAPLLEAVDVSMRFRLRGRGRARGLVAVDRVSVAVGQGEVVAVVGESGSGKSTLARVLAQLHRQTAGEVRLDGEPVHARGTRAFRRYCRAVQYVFQDPFASLNPVHTIRYHLTDPLRIHGRTGGDADAAAAALLEQVRLTPAERFLDRYPHELSGGQRQRVSIARALAAGPRVLLADEPVSMLDVSIRIGILDLLQELQRRMRLGILYITHDIASARHFADRILVMYAGQVVESGGAEAVTQAPKHPYTRLLIGSAPDPDGTAPPVEALSVTAEPPSLVTPPDGCRFHPRCPYAVELCARTAPPHLAVGDGRWAACWGYADAADADGPLPVVPQEEAVL